MLVVQSVASDSWRGGWGWVNVRWIGSMEGVERTIGGPVEGIRPQRPQIQNTDVHLLHGPAL